MRFLVYAGITVVVAIGCGAWLRWASLPVLLAFGAGMRVERIKRHGAAGRHIRQGNLLAMACHSRGHQRDVLPVKTGAAVRGPVNHHRETP